MESKLINGFLNRAVSIAGRPPLLSQKFITTPLPLDIKDEYFALDPDSLRQKAKDTLDECGWSTEEGVNQITVYRARCILTKIREQIAEIALGHDAGTTINELQCVTITQSHMLSLEYD
jgi:hypothetical protein